MTVIPLFICRRPNVGKSNGRVKAIKNAQGKSHVADNGPEGVAVELLPAGAVVLGLDLHGVPEVDGQVGDEEEGNEVTSRLGVSFILALTAPPESVNNHWSL